NNVNAAPVEETEEVVVSRDPLEREAISMNSEPKEDEPVQDQSLKTDLSAEDAPVVKANTTAKNPGQQMNGNTNTGKNPMFENKENTQNLQNNNVSAQVQPQFETEAATPVRSYTSVDTRNVIEQIVTAARTNITDSVRSVEMELNPHNLGKMLMQVTEREGEVSARLVAENQTVKEALETQLANLRDRLNEQGIKVTSVEVTVSTHEFEQNLEEGMTRQNFEGNSNERQNESENRADRRMQRGGIDLSNMDGISELSEEEELLASMMADAGNRMSLKA
nr:flagellar hook-length control protein FliK [Lachnospiraceae bacterium]